MVELADVVNTFFAITVMAKSRNSIILCLQGWLHVLVLGGCGERLHIISGICKFSTRIFLIFEVCLPKNSYGIILIECMLAQSRPTLCDLVNCSLPGSSVHGIFQARILEWVAISSSRGSSQPRDGTRISCVSCIGSQILCHQAIGKLSLIVWITAEEAGSLSEF